MDLPESYLHISDYPAAIEQAQLKVDVQWQLYFMAQEAEDTRRLELEAIPAEGSNAEQRKVWRANQLYDDHPLIELIAIRIKAKTAVNRAEFARDRLKDEFQVVCLRFASDHGIISI